MFDLSRYTPFDDKNPDSGKFQVIPNWQKTGFKGEYVDCMLLLTFNEKRKRRDDKILDVMVDIVNKKAAAGAKIGPKKSGWAAIALTDKEADCPVLGVDEAVLAKKRKYSGFAAVVYEDAPSITNKLNPTSKDGESTEIKEKQRMLSGRSVAAQYPRLNRIEDSFRVMKSNLGLRPMFVRNSDHVRGHITICCLALLMVRLLQHRLKEQNTPMCVTEICTALNGASVAAIAYDDRVMFCHTGHQANVRKGREKLKTKDLIPMIQEGKIKTSLIPDLMRACDLKPLPRMCSLKELGTHLRRRFPTPRDAIPEVRLVTA